MSGPSRGRYVGHPPAGGCRCQGCRAANARYIAEYRRRGGTAVYSEAGASELEAFCWCQAHTRPIPAADVAAGITWTCGPDCSEEGERG